MLRASAINIGVLTAFAMFVSSCGSSSSQGAGCNGPDAPPSCGAECANDDECGFGTYCGQGDECVADCLLGDSSCLEIEVCDAQTGRCIDPGLGICDLPIAPPSCGDACEGDEECGSGTFCSDLGMCIASCEIGDQRCPSDTICNADGKCIPEDEGCIDVEVTPTRFVPNVMFLIDRSGSMSEELSGGNPEPGEDTRWEIARDAIRAVVEPLDTIVNFGFTTYSGDGSMCPRLSTHAIAVDNFATFQTMYPSTVQSETPTGDSIDALVTYLNANPAPSDAPTTIVLATDGEPDTCEQPNPQNGQAESLAAATAAHTAGYDVFVLSVGSDTSTTHLQQMANVGVGKTAMESVDPAPYWLGTSPQALEDAFQEIVSAQISCDVALGGVLDEPDRVCEGDVELDNVDLDCGTDWQLKPGSDDTIQLLGDVCDDWKTAGDPDILTAIFPCGVISPG